MIRSFSLWRFSTPSPHFVRTAPRGIPSVTSFQPGAIAGSMFCEHLPDASVAALLRPSIIRSGLFRCGDSLPPVLTLFGQPRGAYRLSLRSSRAPSLVQCSANISLTRVSQRCCALRSSDQVFFVVECFARNSLMVRRIFAVATTGSIALASSSGP